MLTLSSRLIDTTPYYTTNLHVYRKTDKRSHPSTTTTAWRMDDSAYTELAICANAKFQIFYTPAGTDKKNTARRILYGLHYNEQSSFRALPSLWFLLLRRLFQHQQRQHYVAFWRGHRFHFTTTTFGGVQVQQGREHLPPFPTVQYLRRANRQEPRQTRRNECQPDDEKIHPPPPPAANNTTSTKERKSDLIKTSGGDTLRYATHRLPLLPSFPVAIAIFDSLIC